MKKALSIFAVIILVVLIAVVYFRYFFVLGEGTKAGELNYIVKKGYIWKTNEGRLIQAGLKSQNQGAIQSNEFRFSVTDENVMKQLETSSGSMLQLHYKEYNAMLPWRGMSNFIVDSIISKSNSSMPGTSIP